MCPRFFARLLLEYAEPNCGMRGRVLVVDGLGCDCVNQPRFAAVGSLGLLLAPGLLFKGLGILLWI